VAGGAYPPDVKRYPAQFKDAEGYYAAWRATLSVMGYNTTLVPPRMRRPAISTFSIRNGKASSSNRIPVTSGTSLTGTYAIVKHLAGTISKSCPSRSAATAVDDGDAKEHRRRTGGDGRRQRIQHFIEIDAKSPVAIIYPKEGTPFVTSPTAIFADAPHPNAARVLQNFLYTAKIQQLAVNEGGTRSLIPMSRTRRGERRWRRSRYCPRPGDDAAAGGRHQEAYTALSATDLAMLSNGVTRSRFVDLTAPFAIALFCFSQHWCCCRCPAVMTSLTGDARQLTLEHYRQLLRRPGVRETAA